MTISPPSTIRISCSSHGLGPVEAAGGTIAIGRHRENDIRVRDDRASRFHCIVELTSKGYIVRDLGSRNGTRLNGKRVTRSAVSDGDEIAVGGHVFSVSFRGGSQDDAETLPAESTSAVGERSGGGRPGGGMFDGLAAGILDGIGEEDEEGDEDDGEECEARRRPAGKGRGLRGKGKKGDGGGADGGAGDDARAGDEGDLPLAGGDEGVSSRGAGRKLAVRSLGEAKRHGPSRKAPEGGDPRWADTLRGTIAELTSGAGASVGGDIRLINADGGASGALAGAGDGAGAMRLMLMLAARARATDIHMEPQGRSIAVRVRIDGQMVKIVDLPPKVGESALGLAKNACQFPQAAPNALLDGHFSSVITDRRVDYRASFTPTVQGTKLVLRVLDPRTAPQSLSELALPPVVESAVTRLCRSDSGMLITAGPTGSGKTTTLYNCLRSIDREARNVVTIEDPVEYAIDNTTQIPVTDRQRFGALLRSVLRQDPDVILVGEIRDAETARTAMEAAMTGHLVFSTVHAKDSMSAVFRLLDLGVERSLVANSIQVLLAQRLVKMLCDSCKRSVSVSPGEASRMGRFLRGKQETFVPVGCAKCLRTGWSGRRGLYEVLEFGDELRDCVLGGPTLQAMKAIVGQTAFRTLQQAGWEMAAAGLTSVDEVDRVTSAGV